MNTRANTETMPLDELGSEVERRLEKLNLLDAQRDGRVTSAPDPRTIRYYQTLGLLDRPAYAGREARYGPRHVLQLVAIKILQSEGIPLAEIQSRLYGRSNPELESLVRSAAEDRRRRPKAAAVRSVVWREIVVEPGLKLLVEESWTPADGSRNDPVERIRAILAALARPGGGAGTPDGGAR